MEAVYNFWDSETTGLFDKKWTKADRRQPHIVQLACLITDVQGNELIEFDKLIRPDGYTEIPAEAFNAHGISFERAMDEGLPRKQVLEEFIELCRKCEFMVAHNMWYDLHLLDVACIREFQGTSTVIRKCKQFCSMKAWTPIVKCPPTEKMKKWGFGPYKNASLTEVHEYLFGVGFDKAHDALNDVRAMKKCFFNLPNRPMPTASSGRTN